MSDLFGFKGAEGAGYAQPDPISDDFEFPPLYNGRIYAVATCIRTRDRATLHLVIDPKSRD